MPTRTGASYGTDNGEEGETNWAAEGDAAAGEEEWVETGPDDEDDEDEDLVIEHERVGTKPRPAWILSLAIPECATNGTDDIWGSANIFIDSGMTAERLGRCIIQAVSPFFCNYSLENNHCGTTNHYRSLVGLFGKDDRVFYSLEYILAMDPVDGARRIFCVTKPTPRKMTTKSGANDSNVLSFFSKIITGNIQSVIIFLCLGMFAAPSVLDRFEDWNHFINSLFLLIPQDLPSMWRIISHILDWPARELYRYGPSVVGWEGRDIIDICTQMNRRYFYIGVGRDGQNTEDREYWRQNPEACEAVYRMKEESFARMCRPLWYLTAITVCFIVVRRLLEVFFAKRSGPQLNRIDRAVLDTYQALRMLAREHQCQEDRRQQ